MYKNTFQTRLSETVSAFLLFIYSFFFFFRRTPEHNRGVRACVFRIARVEYVALHVIVPLYFTRIII